MNETFFPPSTLTSPSTASSAHGVSSAGSSTAVFAAELSPQPPAGGDDGPVDPIDDETSVDDGGDDDAPFAGDDDDLAVDDALDDDDDDDAQAGDAVSTVEESSRDLVGDEAPVTDDDDRTAQHDDDWDSFDDEPAAVSEDGRLIDDAAFGEIDPVHPLDADDGGQEGMRELDAEVDESALPELDADGDGGDHPLDREPLLVLPDDTTIGHVETLVGQGCTAIALHEGRVAFLGDAPRILARGASSTVPVPMRATFTAAALDGDTLVVGTARGVELSGAAGVAAAVVPTAAPPRALVASHGRTWALVEGSLFPVSFAAASSADAPRDGVLAVAVLDVGVLALRHAGDRLVLERFRHDDEGWSSTDVDAAGIAAASGKCPALAASLDGTRVAIYSGAGMAESSDRGSTFRAVDAGTVVAVTFAGRGADVDALVLVEADDRLVAARVDREGTIHAIHASPLGPAPAVGAIAWDESRTVAFVGTFDRIYTIGPRRTH